MSFFSLKFAVFLLVVFVVNYIIPAKFRYIWMLLASLYFYVSWSSKYVAVLVIVTAIAYIAARLMDRGKKRKILLFAGIVAIIGILCLFKFWKFWMSGLGVIFGAQRIEDAGLMGIVSPIGLSFFALAAAGYLTDVYKGKIKSEKDIFAFALFISFFPTVISGPIERGTNLLKQIDEKRDFDYEKVTDGLRMMLWGYFLKIIIANRLAVMVDAVFNDYMQKDGLTLIVAAVLYGIQLYADFSGYSLIAIGIAKMFGYDVMENFRQPYFSQNIKEFWGRWHISLSSWLKDYVYIPLGGNRKGNVRKSINLLVTFLVSGLWHGNGLNFLFWGFLHGIYQIAENGIGKRRGKDKSSEPAKGKMIIRILMAVWTFVLVDFAWIFFKSESFSDAISYVLRIFTDFGSERVNLVSSFTLGAEPKRSLLLLTEMLIWFIVDLIHESGKTVKYYLGKRHITVRWAVYLLVCFAIVTGIVYDFGTNASNFIYAAF